MRERLPRNSWRGMALVVLGLSIGASGRTAAAPPCPTGTYAADSPPLLPAGGARISMRDGLVHLEGCTPVTATLRAKKKGVRVKAVWSADECPGIGKVRLQGRLDTACTVMRGVVRAKRHRKRFVASAVSPIPPPTVELDPTLDPAVPEVPGFDGEPPRPVAALTDHSGILLHFVENELIVVSDDATAVGAFAAGIGGSVVRSIAPADYGLSGAAQHLVRFTPGAADPAAVAGDLRTIDPTASGALRVSSETGLGTLAAAAAGAAAGTVVAPNVVMTPHAYLDRATTESPSLPICAGPNAPGCAPNGISNPAGAPEAFNQDAYQWSYMRQGGPQNIGVGEAWRALWLSQRLTAGSIKVAFIDGGFSDSNDHPDGWEHHTNSIHADGFSENDLECTNGTACPWHGTNVVSAAMGVPDDMIGAAGPAGPVAKPVTIRMSGDVFNYLGAWAIAFTSGARILSMSFGARVPAAASFVLIPLDRATQAARDGGMLLLASAGNNGQDVDAEDCAPPFDWPCWEEAWWTPCENGGVTCIGALNGNATTRLSNPLTGQAISNSGGENVELFGPGLLWVGEDPNDPEPHVFSATSAATPFVAGVAALVMAANPNLDGDGVEATLLDSAHPSPDGSVRRYVNAFGAVISALGGGPICITPNIGSLTLPHTALPCLGDDEVLQVGVQTEGILGPITYVWRKYTGDVPMELADGGRISGSRTPVLTIADLQPEDYGSYDVVVSNPCGSSTSGRTSVTAPVGLWEQSGSLPLPREGIELAYDTARQRMVSFGGWSIATDFSHPVFGDTLERVGIAWQTIVPSGDSPSPRYGYALAYDEARGVTVLHGGVYADAAFNRTEFGDTWEWDGTSWSLRATTGPSQRYFHQMVYDASRQRIVLFGGRQGGGALGDLWEWDGTTWTPRAASGDPTYGVPVARSLHGMAYDADRGVIVLHGGQYFLTPPAVGGETWELAGTQWQRRAAADFDTPLYLPDHRAIAYDRDRHTTLIAPIAEGDVIANPFLPISFFEWSAAGSWTRLPGSPPWRTSAAMEYDPVRQVTVLAGGDNGCRTMVWDICALADTWEWRYFDAPATCDPPPP